MYVDLILCPSFCEINELQTNPQPNPTDCIRDIIECLRKCVLKNVVAFRSKKQIAFPPSFWCVSARGKRNPAGDASEIEKGNGDVRDYNIRTAAVVLPGIRYEYSLYVLQSRPSRSRSSIPGTWYTVHASTQPPIQIRGTGVRLARKNSL